MAAPKLLKGWRYAAMIGGLVGAIGLALYPIAVDPYLHPEKWQNIQRENRQGEDRSTMQPGGMKVWSDPFEKKKE
ncbi:hypothetical protein ScPMuIL_011428 [Solemya velum]